MHMKKFINLLSIERFNSHELEPKTVKKTIHFIKNRKENIPLLTVDKMEDKYDEYYLIEGYPEYEALYHVDPDQMVLCNVISMKNRKRQLYSVLARVFKGENTNVDVIKHLVEELKALGEAESAIAQALGCSMEEIEEVEIKNFN